MTITVKKLIFVTALCVYFSKSGITHYKKNSNSKNANSNARNKSLAY